MRVLELCEKRLISFPRTREETHPLVSVLQRALEFSSLQGTLELCERRRLSYPRVREETHLLLSRVATLSGFLLPR